MDGIADRDALLFFLRVAMREHAFTAESEGEGFLAQRVEMNPGDASEPSFRQRRGDHVKLVRRQRVLPEAAVEAADVKDDGRERSRLLCEGRLAAGEKDEEAERGYSHSTSGYKAQG